MLAMLTVGTPDVHDPAWDLGDKLAYLTHLREQGVPAMRENRGRLIDAHGNDRSDLIPQPPADGDISPMLGETMASTAEAIDALIEETLGGIQNRTL